MLRRAIYSRRLRLSVSVAVAAVVAAALALSQSGPAAATVTTLKTFTTPGTYTWTVPTGVTNATFDVFGARGGSVLWNNHGVVTVISNGGAGGEAKAKFKVHGGQVFEIVVGGQGGSATVGSSTGAAGFNGGGSGDPTGTGNDVSGGGGGGSDVRIGGRGNSCAGSKTCGYSDRIIVGGGGGGGSNGTAADGDSGGGLTGTASGTGRFTCVQGALGESAGQECFGGGAGSPPCPDGLTGNGAFGTGGNACPATVDGYGGGGGGWFGGGSGGGFGFAGGGSGYISPLSLSGSFPGGLNTGDGKVIITTTT